MSGAERAPAQCVECGRLEYNHAFTRLFGGASTVWGGNPGRCKHCGGELTLTSYVSADGTLVGEVTHGDKRYHVEVDREKVVRIIRELERLADPEAEVDIIRELEEIARSADDGTPGGREVAEQIRRVRDKIRENPVMDRAWKVAQVLAVIGSIAGLADLAYRYGGELLRDDQPESIEVREPKPASDTAEATPDPASAFKPTVTWGACACGSGRPYIHCCKSKHGKGDGDFAAPGP